MGRLAAGTLRLAHLVLDGAGEQKQLGVAARVRVQTRQ
jgi:hypothetical protein